MKENSKSRTWFKDHFLVFSDPTQLGMKRIKVTYKMKADFEQTVYHPYCIECHQPQDAVCTDHVHPCLF